MEEFDAKELSRAWKCILEQYRNMIKEYTRKEGPGLHLFSMYPRTRKGLFNCQYVFVEQGNEMWKTILDSAPNGKEIEKKYDPYSMYAVSVHLENEDESETIGNIRLFQLNNDEEVDNGGDTSNSDF